MYYGYDNRGLETYAKFASTTGRGIVNTYDGFGRLKQTGTNTVGSMKYLNYLYDTNNNRTRFTFPDNQYFTYLYDGLDRLTTLRETTTNALTLTYTNSGLPDRLNRINGAYSSFGYDEINRLKTLTHNVTSTTNDLTETFAYNPSSQMVSRSVSNTAYLYSGNENITGQYSVNGLNQYTGAEGKSFTYDANGNITSDGYSTYVYDIENRLISVSGAKNLTLQYDPKGRLYRTSGSTTTDFLYDGDALVAEYNSAGTLLKRYMHGPGVDAPLIWYEGATVSGTNRRYLYADRQGSIIGVTNSGGSSLSRNTYDAYGIPSTTNFGRFSYTGQTIIPEIDLLYYKARIYNPQFGRFMQTDPVGYEDQMNLYAYVGNDPFNANDPSGEFGLLVKAIKVAFKGGDVASTFAGAAQDANTVFSLSSTAGTGERLMALGSLLSEIGSPVSTRDAKAVNAVANAKKSPPPTQSLHGNSKASTKDQHIYMIQDADGNIKKIGVSGQPLNKNGTSRRANSQLQGGDNATVLETGVQGRASVLQKEGQIVEGLRNAGERLPDQKRPKTNFSIGSIATRLDDGM